MVRCVQLMRPSIHDYGFGTEAKHKQMDTLRGHFNNVSCVAFSNTKDILVSNSEVPPAFIKSVCPLQLFDNIVSIFCAILLQIVDMDLFFRIWGI